MTRSVRLIRNIAIGVAVFIVFLGVTTIQVTQTDGFRNYVKQKIVVATEQSTGGKVEIGSFAFEWRRLRAIVSNFVIRGNEPPGAAPFLQLGRVELDMALFPGLRHIFQLRHLCVNRPAVNILVLRDGQTNIPAPKQASTSNTSALETVADLAIGHFDLNKGSLTVNLQKQPLNLSGDNLRIELRYSALQQTYHGQISFEPLYMISGRNTPVKFALILPISLGRDRVELHDARISTAASQIMIDASMQNLRNLKTSAHVTGRLALADLKNAADLPIAIDAREPLTALDLEANATMVDNSVEVAGLHLGLGHSNIEASGRLTDDRGKGAVQFRGKLALDELSRLLKVQARPEGTVDLDGTATLNADNTYQVSGNLDARGMSFLTGSGRGARRIRNVDLVTRVRLDPHRLDVDIVRLTALGGEITGNASLEDFARYRLNGSLCRLDLQTAVNELVERRIAYAGVASGTVFAQGDLRQPGTQSIAAHTRLSITPGTRGIPMSGRLNADYNGTSDDISINDSYIALPHTRATLSGSLGNRMDVALTTRDLNELIAAIPGTTKLPVTLEPGGQVTVTAAVTGQLTSPHVKGHMAASRFRVEDRHFDALALDANASSSSASIASGGLNRGAMQTQFSGSVGLRDWTPIARSLVSGDATIRAADLADVMVLAGRPSENFSGALSATMHVSGTIGNPLGWANLSINNGTIQGEPFDQVQAQVTMADQIIKIPAAQVVAGRARIQLSAEFQHPRESFTAGRVHGHIRADQVNLAQFQTLQKQLPNTSGEIELQADASGALSETNGRTDFLLTEVSGNVSARSLRSEGQNYGDFKATARTQQQTLHYDVASDFAGSKISIRGDTQLTPDYPTEADATIRNLPVERALVLAKRTDVSAKGDLSCTAHFAGTTRNPQGNVDLDLTRAVLYQEPIDHVHANITYLPQRVDVHIIEVVAGPSHITLAGTYDHAPGDLQAGNLQFRVNSSGVDLGRICNVQESRPGLSGALQIEANGDVTVNRAGMRVQPHHLNANLAATGLTDQGKKLGDLKLSANTTGSRVDFALDSNLADASIHGRGNAELTGDYPLNAELAFQNATWTRLQTVLDPSHGEPPSFEAVADGTATVSGPVTKLDGLRGSLKLTRVNLNSIASKGSRGPVVIQNQGAVAVTVDRGVARIESLHLTGPGTDFQAHGTASLQGRALDLTLNANSDLAVVKQLNRELEASGRVVLAATVRGAVSQPSVNGRLELHNASVLSTALSNGISNANGVVQFNGNSASVQNLTAESGGGKITAGGFVAFRDTLRFGLRTNASHMRVSVQEGMSVIVDANMNLTGTPEASAVTGAVTIDQLNYAPSSDLGAMLSRAAPPVDASATPSPLLDKMKLDIQVRTSSATAVRTSLAQGLQADADLRIRGTASHPGALGRIDVTEGQLVFFDSTYTVNTGTIGFYNPVRIDPVLNLSLETQTKGVDVVLRVTGPVDNMKLSYTSDPPLQFQEIVELLASGKVPTSDPTLLANQPPAPTQSAAQIGESALVGKALADPVSSQLRRVFGVDQIKVDPTFGGGSELPGARLTLQQNIATNVTFTYVTDVNDPNSQTIRIAWALNPQWSAIGTRDQNGIVSIKLAYKKQFR
jgi:translocation and assembly module TamB